MTVDYLNLVAIIESHIGPPLTTTIRQTSRDITIGGKVVTPLSVEWTTDLRQQGYGYQEIEFDFIVTNIAEIGFLKAGDLHLFSFAAISNEQIRITNVHYDAQWGEFVRCSVRAIFVRS